MRMSTKIKNLFKEPKRNSRMANSITKFKILTRSDQ